MSTFLAATFTIVQNSPTPFKETSIFPNKKTMNFASDHQPSPHHPPLVPCAGDEGTPSPNHESL